jgi:hypothetical protein
MNIDYEGVKKKKNSPRAFGYDSNPLTMFFFTTLELDLDRNKFFFYRINAPSEEEIHKSIQNP